MLLLRQLNKGNFATNSSDSRLFPSLEVLVSHLFVSFQQVDGFQFHLQVAPVEVDGKVATESEPILLELTDFGVDFLYQRKNEFLCNKRERLMFVQKIVVTIVARQQMCWLTIGGPGNWLSIAILSGVKFRRTTWSRAV